MATTLGLSGRALDLPITIAESNNGLVPPAVATHLLGSGGSFLILLQLFMAVAASAASEQIGVSSIVSYDIFKRYISPDASGKQILIVSPPGHPSVSRSSLANYPWCLPPVVFNQLTHLSLINFILRDLFAGFKVRHSVLGVPLRRSVHHLA